MMLLVRAYLVALLALACHGQNFLPAVKTMDVRTVKCANATDDLLKCRAQAVCDDGVVVITLSKSEARALKEELMKVDLRGYEVDVPRFEKQSLQALIRANITKILNLRNMSGRFAVVLIRGIDYGEIAPTTPERALHPTPIPEAFTAAVARLLDSRLVGYEEEVIYSHALFHDIRPVRNGTEGSNGDGKEMHSHMDMSYHHNRPDFLSLAALREGPDPNVKTPFVLNKKLYDMLLDKYPGDIAILKEKSNWDIRTPESAGARKVEMPLLTDDGHAPIFYLRAIHDRMHPQNEAAKKALHHLQELIAASENTAVHLESGDFLLLNNYMALHRRSEFKPDFTIHDRLLMRSYFKVGPVPPNRKFGFAA